jgi:hypothetical protein
MLPYPWIPDPDISIMSCGYKIGIHFIPFHLRYTGCKKQTIMVLIFLQGGHPPTWTKMEYLIMNVGTEKM